MRFPKAARLSTASEFGSVRANGRPQHGSFMILNVLRDAGSARPRIGIITSRRVGGAVERNRVRRCLREIFRKHCLRLPPDCWLVLVARQKAATAEFSALESEWLRLAGRASILREPC
jgi:ribonuclease P protein component